MKVLATADPLGGTFTYTLDLARALAPRGVRVVLATMGGALGPAQIEAARQVPGLELHSSDFALEWMDDPWADVERAGAWLERLADAVCPDVVHLGGYAQATLDLGAPKVLVAHSDVVTWWRAVLGEAPPPRYHRYRQVVRDGLDAARVVVAPTAAYLRALTGVYGPVRDARVVHHGISAPPARREDKDPVVLAAGRLWDEAKNLAALDGVAGRIDWPLCVAGDVEHPDGRRFTARKATLLGALPRAELLGWMRRAAILCHPARYEPFGLVPLEAAANGCALVLSDLPTLREVWGDAALYAPPDDPDAIAREIGRLASDPDLRATKACEAYARARELGLRRQADATFGLWCEVAGRSRPTTAEAR